MTSTVEIRLQKSPFGQQIKAGCLFLNSQSSLRKHSRISFIYIFQLMSKLRSLTNNLSPRINPRRQRYRTEQAFQSSSNANSPDHQSTHRHKYFRHVKSISTSRQAKLVQTNQQIKEKLYHKNFSQFKQIFQSQTNVETLPFIMALRQTKSRMNDPNSNQLTVLQPFQVSDKKTVNQCTKKDVSSIQANRTRAFQASYRWKKRSGGDVRVSCQFESKLRESSQQKSQQQSAFVNYIKPMRYKVIESKRYNLKDIICEHQKKIFNLQGTT